MSEKPRKKRQKKEKDENKPKRAQSAYFIWLNEHREMIKKENPGISITELSKLAGQKWRELKDKKVGFALTCFNLFRFVVVIMVYLLFFRMSLVFYFI